VHTAAPVKPASHDLAPNAHLFGSDTDQAIERMVVSAWRSMSPHVRLTRALSATATVNALTRAGARQRGRTPSEHWRAYAEVRLGAALTDASYVPHHQTVARGTLRAFLNRAGVSLQEFLDTE
jgi:hypothetical protein